MSHENKDFHSELNALRENLPALVEETTPSKTSPQIHYSLDLAKRICDWVAQGKTLHWISRQSEIPQYATLIRWSKTHPELSKMLRAVREARARHFEDAAIDAAEAATGKDADRLKVDTYKWAAEVNDPSVYGKKVAHSGDVGVGVKIVKIITGFGPLPEALHFPKLKADGTIDKDPPKDVGAEVADVKVSPGAFSGDENNAGSGSEDRDRSDALGSRSESTSTIED